MRSWWSIFQEVSAYFVITEIVVIAVFVVAAFLYDPDDHADDHEGPQ